VNGRRGIDPKAKRLLSLFTQETAAFLAALKVDKAWHS